MKVGKCGDIMFLRNVCNHLIITRVIEKQITPILICYLFSFIRTLSVIYIYALNLAI